MSGINYFNTLLKNYRFCQKIKKYKIPLWNGKFPSSTYVKHPIESTFDGKRVLNVGSGSTTYKAPNVVNLDGTNGDGVNIVFDLSKTPLPFKDNEFDLIIANHVLEHVPNWFECMRELARVVKVGGRIEIWIPPVSSDSAFTYRDHINALGIESFAGCLSISRPGSNLWAADEFKKLGHFSNLKLNSYMARPIITWWTMLAPDCVLDWMKTHLRNTVSEEGFYFDKINVN